MTKKPFSEHFKYKEAFVSKEHPRLAKKIMNEMKDQSILNNVNKVFNHIMEPMRKHLNLLRHAYEIRVYPLSVIRDKELNYVIGGEERSGHLRGECIDFKLNKNHMLLTAYDFLKGSGLCSEVILKVDKDGFPVSIHCRALVYDKEPYYDIEEVKNG